MKPSPFHYIAFAYNRRERLEDRRLRTAGRLILAAGSIIIACFFL